MVGFLSTGHNQWHRGECRSSQARKAGLDNRLSLGNSACDGGAEHVCGWKLEQHKDQKGKGEITNVINHLCLCKVTIPEHNP